MFNLTIKLGFFGQQTGNIKLLFHSYIWRQKYSPVRLLFTIQSKWPILQVLVEPTCYSNGNVKVFQYFEHIINILCWLWRFHKITRTRCMHCRTIGSYINKCIIATSNTNITPDIWPRNSLYKLFGWLFSLLLQYCQPNSFKYSCIHIIYKEMSCVINDSLSGFCNIVIVHFSIIKISMVSANLWLLLNSIKYGEDIIPSKSCLLMHITMVTRGRGPGTQTRTEVIRTTFRRSKEEWGPLGGKMTRTMADL